MIRMQGRSKGVRDRTRVSANHSRSALARGRLLDTGRLQTEPRRSRLTGVSRSARMSHRVYLTVAVLFTVGFIVDAVGGLAESNWRRAIWDLVAWTVLIGSGIAIRRAGTRHLRLDHPQDSN